MDNLYNPVVPKWVAEILEYEKNRHHLPFRHFPSGQTRKDWEKWKESYSRKLKYARLNGWTVLDEEKGDSK